MNNGLVTKIIESTFVFFLSNYRIFRPPSTDIDCPVTKLDDDEHRKAITLTTSPGEARRPIGCLAKEASRAANAFPESLNIFATMGVSIVPGQTAFTRIPSAA